MFVAPIKNTFFIGHNKIENELFNDFQKNKLPHSMIFYGKNGIGKETFAYRFSRFILSNNNNSQLTDFSVKKEDSIINQIVENNCLNFYKIEPNPEKKTQIIDVEQIRFLKQKLQKTIEENEYRIVLINPANYMNRNASNALLKILEEPPKNTFFILIMETIDSILPTIRSRCRLIRFSKLSDKEIKEISLNFNENITNDLIEKSNGSLGRLQEILEKKDLISALENVLKKPQEMNAFLRKYSDIESIKIVFNELNNSFQKQEKWKNLKELDSIWKDYNLHELDRQTTLVLMLDI